MFVLMNLVIGAMMGTGTAAGLVQIIRSDMDAIEGGTESASLPPQETTMAPQEVLRDSAAEGLRNDDPSEA